MTSYQRYGHFDQTRQCFVLNGEPPRKWVNVLCTAIGDWEMWNECTHLGDGMSRIRDRAGNQLNLTGYDSKHLYVRDETDPAVFCSYGEPGPTPVQSRCCEIYPGKTMIRSRCNDLELSHRIFVPEHEPVEIWTAQLTNTSNKRKTVSLFAYAMFALTGTNHEGKGFWKETYAEVLPALKGTFCTNRLPGLPIDWANGYLATLNHANWVGGESYRDAFLRQDFSVGSPRCLDVAYNCSGKPAYGPDCAGAIQVRFTLEPGESCRFDTVLGKARNAAEAIAFMNTLSPATIDNWCDKKDQVERERAQAFTIDIGNDHYNALYNSFIKKQLYTYLINKSGFRDNLQVDAALALVDYPAARANFLRALASQYASGEVPHGFRPLNRLTYSDKPAWIFMTCALLIQESGDWGLLDVEVPYFESTEKGTVWEHLLRTMRYMIADVGKHGLSNQHHADWNDGLEATAASGDRESVMVSQQFCYGMRQLQAMAERKGDKAVAAEAAKHFQTMAERINTVAWDGRWYQRSICGDGYRIGSDKAPYGKIFQNTQSWAVLAGICDHQRGQAIMDEVENRLKTDLGYRICNPGWAEFDPRVGHMSNSMPGVNENGGCYNHAAGFKAVADCLLGRADLAWETFRKITPDSPWNPVERSGAEPFSYVNSYSNMELVYGKSGYAWRTGTAGWFTMLLIEYILGARRDWDGLRIDPCLSKHIPQARITRRFRGATYHIHLDNRAGRCRGITRLTCNGKAVHGNLLTHTSGEHQVVVVI